VEWGCSGYDDVKYLGALGCHEPVGQRAYQGCAGAVGCGVPERARAKYKVFFIYDDDTTTEQLTNVILHFKDTMKWEFKPIIEASKTIELYLKSNK